MSRRRWWRDYSIKGYHPSIRQFDPFDTDRDPGDEDDLQTRARVQDMSKHLDEGDRYRWASHPVWCLCAECRSKDRIVHGP